MKEYKLPTMRRPVACDREEDECALRGVRGVPAPRAGPFSSSSESSDSVANAGMFSSSARSSCGGAWAVMSTACTVAMPDSRRDSVAARSSGVAGTVKVICCSPEAMWLRPLKLIAVG